ncbi:MAG: hypothetical protein Kow00109_24810 [Acidobacteriota bacterium]
MPERKDWAYTLCLLGALAWWLLPAAPALLTQAGYAGLGAELRRFWSPVCHQIPERCFHLGPAPLAVCSRCWGLYAGVVFGLVLVALSPGLAKPVLARPRFLILFALPSAIDWALPWNTLWSRFITGAVATLPLGLFLWIGLRELPAALNRFLQRPKDDRQ